MSSTAIRPLLLVLLGICLGFGLSELRHAGHAPAAGSLAAPLPPPAGSPDKDEVQAPSLDAARQWLQTTFGYPVEDEYAEPEYSGEVVMYDQPRLMQQAIAALRPQVPGKTDLYVLAFGGDGSEDVFRNEVEYVDRLFSERFGADGRTLVLENNPATVDTRPLASWTNLETALDALAEVMNPAEDILLLFLTSHGSEDHTLYVNLDLLPLDQIGATDLAEMLHARPFRWKVVVVSACYSGGFVAPLKNATSMIVTAASADRTSFGCGADSDITYFGKAFFAEGLNQSDTFRGAFEIASRLVDEWEKRDEATPSQPQLVSTPLIETKLAEWRAGIRLGKPVLFAPADAPPQADQAAPGQASARSRK